jgi:ABC-2 type transport system ATP-binding protein
MSLITIDHLTKDYRYGRGIFDVSLTIEQGETFGFVGTNGAGKTTTIRHIMGFLRPDSGTATVKGLDCWRDSEQVKRLVGYVPGEIAFPDSPTGFAFLTRQAEMLGATDTSYRDTILDKLQLDASANLKRMSKGMKQKTAIAAAFMHNPDILILDEPTTGLDPLMRAQFIDLLTEEKKKGKTIFMSSHMFDEVEDTCDRVALIKDGKLVSVVSTKEIKHNKNKTYKIEFLTREDYQRFIQQSVELSQIRDDQQQAFVNVHDSDINAFTNLLKDYQIKFFSEVKYTLEAYFDSIYKEG